jgi:four helix bundle protein
LVLVVTAQGEATTKTKESLMEKTNVYDRARRVVQDLAPLLHTIREHDKSLADQLKRAAQSVVLNIAEGRGNDAGNARALFSTACGSAKEVRAALNVASDWGYIETGMAAQLDERLDEVCAITWCLGRRP